MVWKYIWFRWACGGTGDTFLWWVSWLVHLNFMYWCISQESQKGAIEYAQELEERAAMATSPVKQEDGILTILLMLQNPRVFPESSFNSPSINSVIRAKVEDIITICTARIQNDLCVVTAHRDTAFRELAEEWEWVRILEKTLADNKIPLLKYPF